MTIAETVSQSWQFNPVQMDSIYFPAVPNGPNYAWLKVLPPAFKGTAAYPTTPFNGPTAAGNPYLVVTVNGVKTNWSDYNHFNTIDCWKLPNETCTGTLEIYPRPYAEPGDYYVSGSLLGTQSQSVRPLEHRVVRQPISRLAVGDAHRQRCPGVGNVQHADERFRHDEVQVRTAIS